MTEAVANEIEVQNYLEDSRQWYRSLRIANAKFNLGLAQQPEKVAFWKAVLKALED